jgi:heptosyltransferase-3
VSLRDAGRTLVLTLARGLLPGGRGAGAGETPSSVLVVRTDERVGNVLLTVPLLRALRRGLPRARIVLLHAASKRALVQGLPYVDRLEPFARKDLFRHPLRFAGQLLRLRRERFDVVIEAGHWHAFSLSAALIARFVRAGRSIGHDRGGARELLDEVVPPPAGTVQDVAVKLTLLGPLAVAAAGRELETPLATDAASHEEALRALRALGVRPGRLLLVNPGARKADRRWPPERYAAATARVARLLDLDPVILWGPGEIELARGVAGAAGRLAPPTDLRQLAALLREAALVITNDTGPMHLAVACGAPTVAVFLAGDAARWGHELPGFAAVSLGAPAEPEEDLAAIEAAAVRVVGLVDASRSDG